MPLALFDPAVALSLDVARLVDVFRARRARFPVDRQASPLAVARAMFVSEVSDDVARDLADLERFADDDGLHALVEGAKACGRDVSKWPLAEASASVVARVVAARADSPELHRVWRRGRIRKGRALATVPSYDLRALAPRAPVAEEARESRLSAALAEVFGRDLVAVFVVEDGATGDVHAAAVVVGRPKSVATLDAAGGIARLDVRPLVSVRFTYYVEAARLSVKTAAPARRFELAGAFGEALFEDAAYFSSGPSMTFKRLQRDGKASLDDAALPGGVSRVRVVGVQQDSVLSGRVEARGDAPLDALSSFAAPSGGYYTRLTARVDLRGEEQPVDAFLQLPHRLDVAEPRHAPLVRQALAAVGWMEPGTLPDDAWTLAHFAHPEWRWIEVIGAAAFRALVQAKLLVKKRGARVAGQAFRWLGASYVTFEIPGEPGVRYALSEDPSAPARDVTDDELMVWVLDEAALTRKMAKELGAKPEGRAVAGVVDLGLVVLGGVRVRFFYALRPAAKDLAARIAAACTKGVVPVVLVPAGRSVGDGLRQVELSLGEQLGVDAIGHLVGKVAELLEVEDVEPWRLSDARAVIERATQRVWIDGVLMTALAERTYKMLECLALRAGEVVPPKELAAFIGGKHGNHAEIMKKVRPDLRRRVEKSFRDAGREVPAGLLDALGAMEGKRGYRIGVTALVI